ncbi:amphi-Trp domain-containing protein [Halosolutus halophilus]|uniref:amphi-Trp domain-containing protein n=1 Tax=Halosolutus halophilus TaxID=1552990 RepID=UPI0022350A5C|nr:amphi-Trp domain-containing protein [Halosolutus halophilus]
MSYGELLETEREQTPAEVADWLRAFADDLDGTGDLTVAGDDESVTIDRPDETLEFELEVEREPGDDADEIELEIELEWDVPPAETADESETEESDEPGSEGTEGSETGETEGSETDESDE